MSISSPFLVVECDCCGVQIEKELIALASRDSWSDRNVKESLERQGWKIDGDKAFCPECQEEDE